MMFKNILVPYDLSKYALHAYKIALDIAKKYDSKLTIFTCVEVDTWHHMYYDSRINDQLVQQKTKAASKEITKLENDAKKAGISVNSRIVKSISSVKQIVSYAKSHKIDLVVMGSHGRTGFDRLLLGSVANGVSQKVNCPVLIVK